MKKLEEYIRSIPDFPEKGIIFRDITTILQDAEGLKLAIDSMIETLKDVDFDVIVGTESRGFIFGVPIAYAMGKPFVPCRKKGKLPCETVTAEYDLEYAGKLCLCLCQHGAFLSGAAHRGGGLYGESFCLWACVGAQIFFLVYCFSGNPLYDPQCYIPYFMSCVGVFAICGIDTKRKDGAIHGNL